MRKCNVASISSISIRMMDLSLPHQILFTSAIREYESKHLCVAPLYIEATAHTTPGYCSTLYRRVGKQPFSHCLDICEKVNSEADNLKSKGVKIRDIIYKCSDSDDINVSEVLIESLNSDQYLKRFSLKCGYVCCQSPTAEDVEMWHDMHAKETRKWYAKRVKYELSAHHGSLDMDLSTKQSISDTKAIVVMSDKLEFELIIEKVYPIDNTGSIRIYKTKTYLPSRTDVVSNLKLQCELLDNHTVDEALSHMRRACIPGRAARCVIHLDSHDIIITVTQVLKTTTSSIEIQPV